MTTTTTTDTTDTTMTNESIAVPESIGATRVSGRSDDERPRRADSTGSESAPRDVWPRSRHR